MNTKQGETKENLTHFTKELDYFGRVVGYIEAVNRISEGNCKHPGIELVGLLSDLHANRCKKIKESIYFQISVSQQSHPAFNYHGSSKKNEQQHISKLSSPCCWSLNTHNFSAENNFYWSGNIICLTRYIISTCIEGIMDKK